MQLDRIPHYRADLSFTKAFSLEHFSLWLQFTDCRALLVRNGGPIWISANCFWAGTNFGCPRNKSNQIINLFQAYSLHQTHNFHTWERSSLQSFDVETNFNSFTAMTDKNWDEWLELQASQKLGIDKWYILLSWGLASLPLITNGKTHSSVWQRKLNSPIFHLEVSDACQEKKNSWHFRNC